ncbi:MAG: TRAP transporter small permease [Rhodospirillales bacterium]|nr:TRAP transporter small permease [Rhodospirillales bacterium]
MDGAGLPTPNSRGRIGALLDRLYVLSAAIAALCLVAICAVVSLQVAANAADVVGQWLVGRPLGFIVPSYAEFAGFLLAAASFLALPYSLRCGAHIRVTSLFDRFGERGRTAAEIWCSAAGAGLSGYFTWYSVLLVAESRRYGDLSPGMIPLPLWIPQASIAVGLAILTIAFVDRLISLLTGVWPGDRMDDDDDPGGAPADR